MDVHSRGDRSISLEIAAKGPLVATERLIKLIDRNLTVYVFLRLERAIRNADFIRRVYRSTAFIIFATRSTNSYLISRESDIDDRRAVAVRRTRANCGNKINNAEFTSL